MSEARQPILSSFFPALTPSTNCGVSLWPKPIRFAVSRSVVGLVTTKEVIPRGPAEGSVTAVTGEDLADARVRDEDLGAGEPVSTGHAHCPRARATGVGSRTGLGETEAAQNPACGQERNPALLLLASAEGEDRRGAEGGVRGDRDGVAGVVPGQLFDHHDVAQVVQPQASQLAGHGHPQQPLLPYRLHRFPGERRALVERPRYRRNALEGEGADSLL